MTTRTITIEDDEFEELEQQVDDLKVEVSDLENQVDDLKAEVSDLENRVAELEGLEDLWNSKDALLTRIGEI